MTIEEYLATEFRRYFPNANDVTVDNNVVDETIHVHVLLPTGEADHFRLISWVMEIGSDDDWFQFECNAGDYEGLVLTIPLMAEEAE